MILNWKEGGREIIIFWEMIIIIVTAVETSNLTRWKGNFVVCFEGTQHLPERLSKTTNKLV
jgi:hypothetical protein